MWAMCRNNALSPRLPNAEASSLVWSAQIYDQIHLRLASRFQMLAQSRTDAPVRFIEHGASGDEVAAWIRAVCEELRRRPLEQAYWDVSPLPLLVAATETGYTYGGAGHTFWPDLENALNHSFHSAGARERISHLFKCESRRYGGLTRPKTRWADQFCHIAWPITHAVLPLELHDTLAACLSAFGVAVTEETPDDVICDVLAALSAGRSSLRFQGWLAEPAIVGDVVRAFLQVKRPPAALCLDVLQRFLDDLQRYHKDAYMRVKHARSVQAAMRRRRVVPHAPAGSRAANPKTPVSRAGRWTLELRDDGVPRLQAAFPPLPEAVRPPLRRHLYARSFLPRLWGRTAPVSPDALLAGPVFSVEFLRGSSFPSEDDPLLSNLEKLGLDSEQEEALRSLRLPVKLPLVFRPVDTGNYAAFVPQGRVTAGGEYWVVVPADHEAGDLEPLGELSGGLVCLRMQRPEDHALWLADAGIPLDRRLRARLVGDPAGESDGFFSFQASDRTAIHVETDSELRAVMTMRKSGAELSRETINGAGLYRIPLSETEGMIDLEIATQHEHWRVGLECGRHAAPREFANRMRLGGGELTLKSFLAGELSLRLGAGEVPLEGVEADVKLAWSGGMASLRVLLPALPTELRRPFWRKLVSPELYDKLAALPLGSTIRLTVSSPVVGRAEWVLANDPEAVWWVTEEMPVSRELVLPQAMSDSGPAEVRWVSAREPWVALHGCGELYPQDDAVLAVAGTGEGSAGIASWRASRCLYPAGRRLDLLHGTSAPPRLLRQPSGSGNGVGFLQLTERYLDWATAFSDNWQAEFRRLQAARQLELLVVKASCGEAWIKEELRAVPLLDAGRWPALFTVCRLRGIGFDDGVEFLPSEIERFRDLVVTQMRYELPELWTEVEAQRSGRPPAGHAERVSAALDSVFAGVYELLAAAAEEGGDSPRAEELRGADPGTAAEAWMRGLAEAQRRAEGWGMCDMLVPTDAEDSPRLWHYEDLTAEDLAAMLWSWQKRYRAALQGRLWTEDETAAALDLWLLPTSQRVRRTPSVWGRLLADRWTSRLIRYAALRHRAVRSSDIMEEADGIDAAAEAPETLETTHA